MNLKDASIIDFRYNAIGDTCCAHCGMGIKHLVIVRDPDTGKHVAIGSKCAERIGMDRDQIRRKETTEKRKEREAREEIERVKWLKQHEAAESKRAKRAEKIKPIVDGLRELECNFYHSLAIQLESNQRLSYRQAEFVCKAFSNTGRRNKKNADWWDDLIDLMTD